MEGTEREIADLDSVLFQVEEAEVEDAEGLETVREELEEARIFTVPRKQRMAKEKKEASSPVRRFRSAEGLGIFCGKHNVGNEYLPRKIARGNDLWFHAQGQDTDGILSQLGYSPEEIDAFRAEGDI